MLPRHSPSLATRPSPCPGKTNVQPHHKAVSVASHTKKYHHKAVSVASHTKKYHRRAVSVASLARKYHHEVVTMACLTRKFDHQAVSMASFTRKDSNKMIDHVRDADMRYVMSQTEGILACYSRGYVIQMLLLYERMAGL